MLNDSQLIENWDELLSRLETFGDRAEKLKKLYLDWESRIATLPASGTEHYHNCFPGGYVDHILRVDDYSVNLYKFLSEHTDMDLSGFSLEELRFVALHHDLGKIGEARDGGDGYLPNPSDWHRKNQGKLYIVNEENNYMTIPDRSIFLLQEYGVPISQQEFIAIRAHDGLYDEANKGYYLGYQASSRFKTNLTHVIHQADMQAALAEQAIFERGGVTEKTSISTSYSTPRTAQKASAAKKLESVGKSTDNNLMSTFNDIFGED